MLGVHFVQASAKPAFDLSMPSHLGHDVKADLATNGEGQIEVAKPLLQDAHQRGPAK